MKDRYSFIVDWELDREAFKKNIETLIRETRARGKVLSLPIGIVKGEVAAGLLSLLLSMVNCEGCNAPCCRSNPHDSKNLVDLIPQEYQRLRQKYGDRVKPEGIPMPCTFLENNRCSIYKDRPFVCIIYPFQAGAYDGDNHEMIALDSQCPESARIAMKVYMVTWELKHHFWQLAPDIEELLKE